MLCAWVGRRIAPIFSLSALLHRRFDSDNISTVHITFDGAFWVPVTSGIIRREAEWGRIFEESWAIWLHGNEVIFEEQMVSVDGVEHDVGSLVATWCRGGE